MTTKRRTRMKRLLWFQKSLWDLRVLGALQLGALALQAVAVLAAAAAAAALVVVEEEGLLPLAAWVRSCTSNGSTAAALPWHSWQRG
jgi:hypothetical protein